MERLRSKEDYEIEKAFIEQHSGNAELVVDEQTGRVAAAIYTCPISGFYKLHPNSDYAYSDMTGKIDAVINNGPDHPDALSNVCTHENLAIRAGHIVCDDCGAIAPGT